MNIGLALAAAGFVITVLGLPMLWANWHRARSEKYSGQFCRIFEHTKTQYPRLNSRALSAIEYEWKSDGLPMLIRPGWILAEPSPLESIRLTLLETWTDVEQLTATCRRARRIMPIRADGSRYLGYSQALTELGAMAHLYNGLTYRPLEVKVEDGGLEIIFTLGRYFDHLDTSVLLAFESAARDLAGKRKILNGSYRRYLGDPFNLSRRATGLGVSTLTVRRGENGCGFYMHRRDGYWVAEGPEAIHAIPAGEFTPSDVGLHAQREDFDLWRNIMREYAEEFLDTEEAYGRGGRPIDYIKQSPFKELDEARRSGRLAVYVLGIGLDPLDWKPGIFTICIFEAKTFDSILAKMVPQGKEGTILVGPRGEGIPFNSESVRLYANNPNTVNAGAVCLKLAWQHRGVLGLDCR